MGHPHRVLAARPLVGVTGPAGFFRFGWWFTRFALKRSGACSVYLTAHRPALPRAVDAIVVGGGDDINPGLYGGLVDTKAAYDEERDAFELDVIEQALGRDLPILGICRGAQLLNVKLGGTLFADIRHMRNHTSNRNTFLPAKTVRVKPDSRLRSIIDTDVLQVNSLHHQAIDKPGDGLVVVARDRDDIVQAIEHPTRTLMGVQWHPEYIPQQRQHQAIFASLVGLVQSTQ